MAKVIGFVGFSSSGKTTLITKVILILKQRGYQVAVIKHDAHGHYKEAPGTDSSKFMEQDADKIITVSPASIHIYEKRDAPNLEEIITSITSMDYILIEGFKKEKHPQIAVFRDEAQRAILELLEAAPIAIATDRKDEDSLLPVLDLNDPEGVADFIQAFGKKSSI
jgi:molybdopterin-guanine dinucleotide biosynthesis protein B